MIIIVDDTFIDRPKSQNLNYLQSSKYAPMCKIQSIITTSELSSLVKNVTSCKLFCNHKTLQLYDNEGKKLDLEINTNLRETLINKVYLANIPRIEFSRGLETDIETNKIDKDLFYSNLKSFLDYYITNNILNIRILYWGEEYEEIEKLSIIQNMLIHIRMLSIEKFKSASAIKAGLKVIYPTQEPEDTINDWLNYKLTNSQIIQEINNKII